MKREYTPGPWSNNKWNCQEHQISAKGGTIALVGHGHTLVCEDEADANARLIASSPDLLEALQDIATWLISPDLSRGTLEQMQRKARAAIARAEGENTPSHT